MTAGKAMASGRAIPSSPIPLPESVARGAGHDGPGLPALRQPPDLSKLKRASVEEAGSRSLKRTTVEEAGSRNELAWLLVLDNLVDAGTAESHWLDQVGTRLIQGGTRRPQTRTRTTTGPLSEGSTKGARR